MSEGGFGVDILAIAAHADDVELCCGGLLAKTAAAGRRAAVIDMTRGEMGTRGTPEIRAEEARAAAEALGLAARECLGLPDARIENTEAARLAVVETLRKHRPRVVIAPHPTDLHPDHARTGEIVRDAYFLARLRRLGAGGSHRPRALLYMMHHTPFEPTFVVDVTDSFDRKMAACRAYVSQLHDPSSREPRTQISDPLFLEAIESRARYFGSLIGVRYGEAFQAHETLPVSDVVSLFGGGGETGRRP